MSNEMILTQLNEFKEKVSRNSPCENKIITLSEIEISYKQLEIMCSYLFGWSKEEAFDYYEKKINGSILLSNSVYTTREDQPDIQTVFNLGIERISLLSKSE